MHRAHDEPAPITIAVALAAYLRQLEADGRSPHTIGQYRRNVRLLAAWLRQEGHSGHVGDIGHESPLNRQ